MPKQTRHLFWKTFWISLVSLGIIFAVFYLSVLWPVRETAQPQSNIPIEESYLPAQSDNQNILLIGCEERNEPASFFVLLRFDAEENCCYVLSLPPEAEATVNVKTMTLLEHYQYGGYEAAVDAAENLFLIHIQKYLRADRQSICALVDYFGGIETELPERIQTEHYQLEPGRQRLDGDRVADLLMTGDLSRSSGLICTYLNQCLTESLIDRRQDFYSILFNQCDTNFTSLEFSNRVIPMKRFFRKSGEKAFPLTAEGSYSEDGTRFVYSETAGEQIRERFV